MEERIEEKMEGSDEIPWVKEEVEYVEKDEQTTIKAR